MDYGGGMPQQGAALQQYGDAAGSGGNLDLNDPQVRQKLAMMLAGRLGQQGAGGASGGGAVSGIAQAMSPFMQMLLSRKMVGGVSPPMQQWSGGGYDAGSGMNVPGL